MKTKTTTLRLELPTNPDELLRNLSDLRQDPEVVAAERRLTATEAELSRAREEFQRLDSEAHALPDRIRQGHASAMELDAALTATRRAGLLVAAAERAVSDAQSARALVHRR